jgi:hypothetical protein
VNKARAARAKEEGIQASQNTKIAHQVSIKIQGEKIKRKLSERRSSIGFTKVTPSASVDLRTGEEYQGEDAVFVKSTHFQNEVDASKMHTAHEIAREKQLSRMRAKLSVASLQRTRSKGSQIEKIT